MQEPIDNTRETQQQSPVQSQPSETVGDIIHKERVTKRITIETIAKDLKLNAKYIKALESNSYDDLPAEPYIRVYLRSIATYLMLNPDEILKKFFEDRGISTSQEAEKIKISLEKDNQKQSFSWVIIVVLVVILAIVSYVSNKMGWINNNNIAQLHTIISQDTTDTQDSLSLKLKETDKNTLRDTALNASIIADSQSNASRESRDTIKLVIKTKRDSVWVQAFSDGVSWKNYIKAQTSKTFLACDSIVVNVGNNSLLKYTLNDNKLDINGKGVKIFKIDHTGVTFWEMDQWKNTFKDRL